MRIKKLTSIQIKKIRAVQQTVKQQVFKNGANNLQGRNQENKVKLRYFATLYTFTNIAQYAKNTNAEEIHAINTNHRNQLM